MFVISSLVSGERRYYHRGEWYATPRSGHLSYEVAKLQLRRLKLEWESLGAQFRIEEVSDVQG